MSMSEPTPELTELTSPPAQLRAMVMTLSMALKLAAMTRAQAVEQAYRDAELQIRQSDLTRQATEDLRSIRRNRNRVFVLCMGLVMSILWPAIMLHFFHSTVGTAWTTAVANTGDMLVTLYAWRRRY